MKVTFLRDVFTRAFTLASVSITYDGAWHYTPVGWQEGPGLGPQDFCYGLEDPDRGLDLSMSTAELKRRKVAGNTCIPTGEYDLTIAYSPAFKRNMLTIPKVAAYSGVRVHGGTDPSDTRGCPILGKHRDTIKGRVYNSTLYIDWLFARVDECMKREEPVRIAFTRADTWQQGAIWQS